MRGKRFIIIILVILMAVTLVNKLKVKEINKSDIDINQFIESADVASGNNAQINWKEVAALLAVTNKNNMKVLND